LPLKEYASTVGVRATPEAVWAILTDGPGYADWNPEINRIDGRIALGEKLKAHVVLHGGKVQPVSVPADWVRDMIEHYRRTGSYRPEDMRRLLGDPTKGVDVGAETSLASFLAERKTSMS
jgi:Polyketide cyclase / dehydrase and lipid transport